MNTKITEIEITNLINITTKKLYGGRVHILHPNTFSEVMGTHGIFKSSQVSKLPTHPKRRLTLSTL